MTLLRLSIFLFAAVVLVAASHPLFAAGDDFVVRNVRVFDGVKLSETPMSVFVKDGKIAAMGNRLDVDASSVIDGTGKTLLPGLIDGHTHVLSPQVLRQAAAFGVTTELDMFMPVDLAKQLRTGDELTNFSRADFRTAGTLVTVPGGHGTQYGVPIPTITAPDDAARFVEARIAEGSDFIKLVYDRGVTAGMTFPTLSRETLAAVIAAAHAKDRMAVVHVTDLAAARDAVEAGADGLVHIVCDEPVDDALLKAAVERKIFVTPTLAVMERFGREADDVTLLARDPQLVPLLSADDIAQLNARFPRRAQAKVDAATAIANVRQLHEAGVRILAGTDVPNPGTVHGASLHRELELLVQAGLSPAEALAAATSVPADAFKLADRGRIAEGKRADLVLVNGDPTKDVTVTRAIEKVWIAGRVFDHAAYRATVDAKNKAAGQLAKPGPLMVSDFEAPTGEIAASFGLGWSVSTDQLQRGRSTCEIKLVDGGADGSKKSLLIRGSINPPLPWAWAGAMFSPGTTLMGPADLSGKKKISFWARGDGRDARVMIFSRSGGFAPAFLTFKPGAEWERHTFELKAFRDGETGKDLTAVLFSGGVEHGPFEFRVDQVMFE
jgi:imidazolonepropionase-like amidohydrolase